MSYNPSIPQPTDNLSTSQGQMLANFGQLNLQYGSAATTAGGQIQISFVNSAAVAALLANIGPLDASITYAFASGATITGNLAGVLKVDYVARNVDGSITAYGSGYTNS